MNEEVKFYTHIEIDLNLVPINLRLQRPEDDFIRKVRLIPIPFYGSETTSGETPYKLISKIIDLDSIDQEI